MTDLVAWLRGALDEHERIARAAQDPGNDWWWDKPESPAEEHIRAWRPEVVLRTVAAHREILGRHFEMGNGDCDYCWRSPDASWPCPDVRSLTAIYRDQHPGFDPSWIGES